MELYGKQLTGKVNFFLKWRKVMYHQEILFFQKLGFLGTINPFIPQIRCTKGGMKISALRHYVLCYAR
jgi:L-fucose isomerase-like protein